MVMVILIVIVMLIVIVINTVATIEITIDIHLTAIALTGIMFATPIAATMMATPITPGGGGGWAPGALSDGAEVVVADVGVDLEVDRAVLHHLHKRPEILGHTVHMRLDLCRTASSEARLTPPSQESCRAQPRKKERELLRVRRS